MIIKKPPTRETTNLVFVWGIFSLYLLTFFILLFTHETDAKLFQNALPIANISPFVFFTLPLALLPPFKKVLFPLITFLSVGMIFSIEISNIRFIESNTSYNFALTLDGLAHVGYTLFGIYLVVSHQVRLNLRSFLLGGVSILSVVAAILVLNYILHTSFFGLNLYGEHSIYELVICSSSILSATIYILGLIFFLILGYVFQLLNLLLNKKLNS